jgi:hypothetical protein
MQGTITGKEVILHWLMIIRLWGAGCYLRCLRAVMSRTPSTFLGVIARCRSQQIRPAAGQHLEIGTLRETERS